MSHQRRLQRWAAGKRLPLLRLARLLYWRRVVAHAFSIRRRHPKVQGVHAVPSGSPITRYQSTCNNGLCVDQGEPVPTIWLPAYSFPIIDRSMSSRTAPTRCPDKSTPIWCFPSRIDLCSTRVHFGSCRRGVQFRRGGGLARLAPSQPSVVLPCPSGVFAGRASFPTIVASNKQATAVARPVLSASASASLTNACGE